MHRSLRSVLVVIAVMACATACSDGRYIITQTKGGDLARLDKWTGQVAWVEGEHLVLATLPNDPPDRDSLAKAIWWPSMGPLAQLGDATHLRGPRLALVTNCRDRILHYRFTVAPLTDPVLLARTRSSTSFTILLQDKDQFNLVTVPIAVNDMVKTTDSTGQAWGLTYTGSTSCQADIYRDIKTWDVVWALGG